MNLSLKQMGDILMAVAREYRIKMLVEIFPAYNGKIITEDIIRKLLQPFVSELKKEYLSLDDQFYIQERLDNLNMYNNLLNDVWVFQKMHKAGRTNLLTKKNADALLIIFVNEACYPLRLNFCTKDLDTKSVSTHLLQLS